MYQGSGRFIPDSAILAEGCLDQGVTIWRALEPGAEGKAHFGVTFASPRNGPCRVQVPRGHSSHGTG